MDVKYSVFYILHHYDLDPIILSKITFYQLRLSDTGVHRVQYNIGTRSSLVSYNYTVSCVADRGRYLLLFYCFQTGRARYVFNLIWTFTWSVAKISDWRQNSIVLVLLLRFLDRLSVGRPVWNRAFPVKVKSLWSRTEKIQSESELRSRATVQRRRKLSIPPSRRFNANGERHHLCTVRERSSSIVTGVIIVRVRRCAHFTHNSNYCS